jgi:hypothetical protein
MSTLVKVFLQGEKVKTFGNETLQLEPLVSKLSSKLSGKSWSFSIYDKAQGRQPNHFKCSGYIVQNGGSMSIQYNKKGSSVKTPFIFDHCVSYLYLNVVDSPMYEIQVYKDEVQGEPLLRQYCFMDWKEVCEPFMNKCVTLCVNDVFIEEEGREEAIVAATKDMASNIIKIVVKDTNVKPTSYFWWGQQ